MESRGLRIYLASLVVTLLLLCAAGATRGVTSQTEAWRPDGRHDDAFPTTRVLRFAVIGDAGTADEHQMAVAQQMLAEYQRNPYSVVLTVGDNTYQGCKNRLRDVFETPYRELLNRDVQFYATLGNHDEECAQEQVAYRYFNMGGKRYYSFAPAGDLVEFFALDTTLMVSGKESEQYRWLEEALGASRATWKIAFFHHPPFSPAKKHGDDKTLISLLVPLLERYRVRVVLTGHDHVFAKLATRKGVDYFVCGTSAKLLSGGIDQSYSGIEYSNDEFRGFMVVTLTPESYDYSLISENGAQLYRSAVPLVPAGGPSTRAKPAARF